jgi:ABC-type branched-subunit amino acid transport system substrate-binding protein
MKNKLTITVIILVLIIIGFAFYTNQDSGIEDGKIKVGLIAGLSGQYAEIGESVRDGLVLSLKDAENIELIVEDSGFDPVKGLSAYKKLVEVDKVDIIVGADSLSLPGITPLLEEDNIPYIQLFESNLHEEDNLFQIMPFSYPLFTQLAEAASDRYDSVALVYNGSSDLFIENVEYFRKGIDQDKIVTEVKLSQNSDFRTEALKVINSGADAYTLIMTLNEGTRFINSINNQKGNKEIMPICDANLELAVGQYIEQVGSDSLEGCISTNIPSRMTTDFLSMFEQEYGRNPVFGADWAYDAGYIVKEISDEPRENWIEEIENINFDGASGMVELDENGTRFADAVVKEYQNGTFVEIE